MKKILLTVCSACLCLLLLLGLLDSVVLSALNANEMASLFETYARVPGEKPDYADVSQQLMRYLKSGDDRLLPQAGGASLFSEKENAHLKDCSALIRGMMHFRIVFLVLLVLTAVGVLLAWRRGAAREKLVTLALNGFNLACLVLALFALALIIWGLTDFNSLFLAFHRVVFTNDLWLLDPSKDLLIQLMPEPFFRAYAGRIAVRLAPILLMLAAVPFVRSRFKEVEAGNP